MGFFKKIFKPVRKVLDKVIPNEIKPALPYLAALTPFMAPTTGIFGTMAGRALLSGGANIAAQLAQEGTTEDDLNLLSAGIAATTGALSAPGASAKLESFKSPMGDFAPARNIFQKGRDLGITGLQKASNFLSAAEGSGGVGDILRPGGTKMGFDAATATALGVPAAQGIGDAMYTDAVILQKQQIIDDALAAAELLEDSGARAQAIRNAMSAYQFFTEEEIEDTISAAGYRAGGRVGFKFGGIDKAIENVTEEIEEKGEEGIMKAVREDPLLIEEYNKYVFDLLEQRPNAKPMSFQEFKRMIKSGMKSGGRVKMEEGGEIKEGIMLIADETGGEPDFGSKEYYEEEVEKKIADLNKMMNEDKMYHLSPWSVGMIEELILKANNKGVDILELTEVYEDAKNSQAEWFQSLPEDQQEFWKKHYQEDFDRTTDMGIFPGQQEFGASGLEDKSKRGDNVPPPKRDRFDIEGLETLVQEAKDGGLMNLGGKEMDLRGGGFVPIGKKERADDVPARLSKNEFVMTADAVRAAGGGSVNKGAKRMYNLMNTLEARA